MKKENGFFLKMLVIVLVFGIVVVGCAHQQTQSIRNETGYIVTEVYIRETGTSSWGNVRNIQARRNSQGNLLWGDSAGWDRFNINNNAAQMVFYGNSRYSAPSRNQDILIRDSNGLWYMKRNIPITLTVIQEHLLLNAPPSVLSRSDPITFTIQDRLPMLFIENQTGFQINITAPTQEGMIGNGARTSWQNVDQTQNITVAYRIGNFQHNEQVTMGNVDTTVSLTKRPPLLFMKNQTGFPITINAPSQGVMVNNGDETFWLNDNQTQNITVTYRVGTVQYTEQVTMGNEDAIVILTRSPPNITITNNVGATINMIFLRQPNSPEWIGGNILTRGGTVHLARQAQTGDISGSIVNRDSMRIWMGNIPISGERFDIRIDDVQGNTFVKSNVELTSDITIVFTQSDRR